MRFLTGIPRGQFPSLNPKSKASATCGQPLDAHSTNPQRALQIASSLGGQLGHLYVLDCEPGVLETEDGQLGLSERVEAAMPNAIEMFLTLLHELLSANHIAEFASDERR